VSSLGSVSFYLANGKGSQSCQVTYERIVELNEEDTTEDRTPRTSPTEVLQKSPSRHETTEEELKCCFRRLTLTAPVAPSQPVVVVQKLHDIFFDTLGEEAIEHAYSIVRENQMMKENRESHIYTNLLLLFQDAQRCPDPESSNLSR
jgi:hypothetical protein